MQLPVATITGKRDQKGGSRIFSNILSPDLPPNTGVFKSPKWTCRTNLHPLGFFASAATRILATACSKGMTWKRLMRVFFSDCGYVNIPFPSKSYLISWFITAILCRYRVGNGRVWSYIRKKQWPKKQQQKASLAIATWLGSRIFTS